MFAGRLHDRSSPPDPADAVALLRDCHARIRYFLAEAEAIAESYRTAIAPARRAESARHVRRYFGQALPLHEADEDESIAPRLRAAGFDPQARVDEHAAIDALVAELELDWHQIAREGGPPRDLDRHRDVLDRLRTLMARHLAAEEGEVFPRIDALPWPERVRIVREMRARRA